MASEQLTTVSTSPAMNFAESVNAVIAAQQPKRPIDGAFPYAVVPEGYEVKYLDGCLTARQKAAIEGNLPAGYIELEDAPSFVRYIDAFKGPDTALFANRDARTVDAKLDYHVKGMAGTRLHAVQLKLRHSEQWKAWNDIDRTKVPQLAFGEFIEDHIPDIVEPSGAQLLEVARDLVVKTGVSFKSQPKVESGALHFEYVEVVDGFGKSGELEIPQRIALEIPIFEFGPKIRVECRLRYRLEHERVHFIVLMDRADELVKAAFDASLKEIEDQTELVAYHGSVKK